MDRKATGWRKRQIAEQEFKMYEVAETEEIKGIAIGRFRSRDALSISYTRAKDPGIGLSVNLDSETGLHIGFTVYTLVVYIQILAKQ